MKFAVFLGGLIIGLAGGAAILLYVQSRDASNGDNTLIFAPKNYADFGDSTVGISGTLTGEGVGFKNNTYAILCIKDRKECWLSSTQQVGGNQLGRLDYSYYYPITNWTAAEVVMEEETGPSSCSKTTITISRRQQSALWVQEPINQTRAACKDSDSKMYKWTIEDSPGWKRVFGK